MCSVCVCVRQSGLLVPLTGPGPVRDILLPVLSFLPSFWSSEKKKHQVNIRKCHLHIKYIWYHNTYIVSNVTLLMRIRLLLCFTFQCRSAHTDHQLLQELVRYTRDLNPNLTDRQTDRQVSKSLQTESSKRLVSWIWTAECPTKHFIPYKNFSV